MKNLLFALAALMLAGGVNAAPMDYAYTSGPLSPSGSDGIPAVTNISTSFTADLAPNLVFDIYSPIDVTDFIMSDGVTTVRDTELGDYLFEVYASTDDAAAVTRIEITVWVDHGLYGYYGVNASMGLQVWTPATTGASTSYTVPCDPLEWVGCTDHAVALSDTVAGGVVPLPAAAWLFLSALGGLAIVKRKRS